MQRVSMHAYGHRRQLKRNNMRINKIKDSNNDNNVRVLRTPHARLSRRIAIITSLIVFENTRNRAVGKTIGTRGEKASDPGRRLTGNFSIDYVI